MQRMGCSMLCKIAERGFGEKKPGPIKKCKVLPKINESNLRQSEAVSDYKHKTKIQRDQGELDDSLLVKTTAMLVRQCISFRARNLSPISLKQLSEYDPILGGCYAELVNRRKLHFCAFGPIVYDKER